MAWPVDDINLTNTDQGSDDPSLARTDLNITQQRLKEVIAGRGTADGVCDLDSSAKVPISRLPTVTVPYGGTGVTSITTYGLVYGNGTGAVGAVAPGTSGYLLRSNGTGSPPDYTNSTAYVSANDTTPGYLNGKLVAGSGISLTENNDGANETLTIANTGAPPGSIGGTELRQATSGTYQVAASDTVASTFSTSFVKVKEIRTPYGGTFNIYFQLQGNGGGGGTGYVRIYLDGVYAGYEFSNSSSGFVTYTQDVVVGSDGQLIQLYLKTTDVSYSSSVRYFRIREADPTTVFAVVL